MATRAPRITGVVERGPGVGHARQFLVRADQPCDALVHAFTMPMGATVVALRAHLYGDEARAIAAREEPIWQSWLLRHFPMAASGPA